MFTSQRRKTSKSLALLGNDEAEGFHIRQMRSRGVSSLTGPILLWDRLQPSNDGWLSGGFLWLSGMAMYTSVPYGDPYPLGRLAIGYIPYGVL